MALLNENKIGIIKNLSIFHFEYRCSLKVRNIML